MSELQEKGAELWVIAPDKPEKLEAMRKKHGLEFPVLVDTDCTVAKAYGILNEESGKMPHPAALVIDKEGVIKYFRVDEDYSVRPAPEEVFEVLGNGMP